MGLVPEIQAEGQSWKFIGVQSKNRKEWNIIHLANMMNNVTTVGLYDTLGE
jgi:long-subunit acyl-CoA synthetase (AMP-forming)